MTAAAAMVGWVGLCAVVAVVLFLLTAMGVIKWW